MPNNLFLWFFYHIFAENKIYAMSKELAYTILEISFILYVVFIGSKVYKLYKYSEHSDEPLIIDAVVFFIETFIISLFYVICVVVFSGLFIWE